MATSDLNVQELLNERIRNSPQPPFSNLTPVASPALTTLTVWNGPNVSSPALSDTSEYSVRTAVIRSPLVATMAAFPTQNLPPLPTSKKWPMPPTNRTNPLGISSKSTQVTHTRSISVTSDISFGESLISLEETEVHSPLFSEADISYSMHQGMQAILSPKTKIISMPPWCEDGLQASNTKKNYLISTEAGLHAKRLGMQRVPAPHLQALGRSTPPSSASPTRSSPIRKRASTADAQVARKLFEAEENTGRVVVTHVVKHRVCNQIVDSDSAPADTSMGLPTTTSKSTLASIGSQSNLHMPQTAIVESPQGSLPDEPFKRSLKSSTTSVHASDTPTTPKTVKTKKSGFLKMFGKLNKTDSPTVPSLPISRPVPIAPPPNTPLTPTIDVPRPQLADRPLINSTVHSEVVTARAASFDMVTSTSSHTTPTRSNTGNLSNPPEVPQSAPATVTAFSHNPLPVSSSNSSLSVTAPTLSLRPISMVFSNAIPQDLLADSQLEADAAIASDYANSISPITDREALAALQARFEKTQEVWIAKMQERDTQILALRAELEVITKIKDDVSEKGLPSGSSTSSISALDGPSKVACDKCGCKCGKSGSVLDRTRAIRPAALMAGRFVN